MQRESKRRDAGELTREFTSRQGKAAHKRRYPRVRSRSFRRLMGRLRRHRDKIRAFARRNGSDPLKVWGREIVEEWLAELASPPASLRTNERRLNSASAN